MGYTKYKDPWAVTDQLTAKAWNYIETQWDQIKTDSDAHAHDTRYYTKTLADTTFFSTSYFTGFDADKLDGSHLSDIIANVMPIGAIMIWKGTDADVPTGWHICDGGTYGGYATPDLRDRFVKGAGGDYAVNSTGGPATWNGTITPTGTVTVGDHVLTNAELPVHSHSYTEYHNPVARSSGSGSGYPNVDSYWDSPVGEQSTGGGSHGHTGSSIAFSGVDPRPLYYALYYIMKVA